MATIHPFSFVDPSAELADDVIVGPFCNVEAKVVIGPGCHLDSHCTLKTGTKLGSRVMIGQGAVLGSPPQDKKYAGEPTFLEVGDDVVIREFVTLNRGTGEGTATKIGNRCYLMSYAHVAHNCTLEEDVTISNSVALGGHVTVETLATIGGLTGVHQYVRIGKVAMIVGMSGISQDAPPFMLTGGRDPETRDINAVGLRRIGLSQEARMHLHKAGKLLFKAELGLHNAIEYVRREVEMTPEVVYLLEFMQRRYHGKNGRGDQH